MWKSCAIPHLFSSYIRGRAIVTRHHMEGYFWESKVHSCASYDLHHWLPKTNRHNQYEKHIIMISFISMVDHSMNIYINISTPWQHHEHVWNWSFQVFFSIVLVLLLWLCVLHCYCSHLPCFLSSTTCNPTRNIKVQVNPLLFSS